MRQLILDRFADSVCTDDVVGAATERVEPELLAAWFRLPLRAAAVLVPLAERRDEIHVLLTERTHTVRDHPGQVAFPGGMAEPEDVDLRATALRESEEEIGLAAAQVEVVGYLPAQAVITGYAVQPVVGFYAQDFAPRIDTGEVAGVFEVPLSFLLNRENMIRVDRERKGVILPTYEYHYDDHRIWGATALMIRQFIDILH